MFNAKNGYAEAYIRGCQTKGLGKRHYIELARCESIDDVKTYLQTTSEYSSYLGNLQAPYKPSSIVLSCRKRQLAEFKISRQQAAAPLSKFLDYLTYGHMIDNLILVLSGKLRGRTNEEILENCNLLGVFESLPTAVASNNVQELYQLVLVDTPLAKYLSGALSAEDLTELNVELVRNVLYKEYLQDFMRFCSNMDQTTHTVMKKMLSLEADRHAIRITVNSFGTELSKFDRQSLYANFGNLHPIGQGRLVHCESLEEVRDILSSCPEYSGLANITSFHDIDRRLHVLELGNCHQAFELQFNFAIFYAFAKLQENELNNLMWLCECISQQQKGNLEEGLVHVGN